MASATLYDYSDREMLHILDDVAGPDGWIETEHIARKMFGATNSGPPSKDALRCVAVRMSWMRRYGLVEKSGKSREARWRMTEFGERALKAGLKSSEVKAVENLDEEDLAEVMMRFGARYHYVSREAATLMRREWQRETSPKRLA